ncbi:MAG: hypothetical protein FJ215_01095 [Ignavibacteria bacterium]|nr:hypothetical protein [Ignavibacteria bacterium]
MKTTICKTMFFAFILSFTLLFAQCDKDEPTQPTQDKPEIVGCNSVKYKGVTFSNIGCAPGIASFDVSITQGGVSASFHVTCSGGCISSVTVK